MLQGKTIVVSGVGAGLGTEIASTILRDGGNIVIGARTASTLAEIANALDPSGERVAHRATDITVEGDPEALVALGVERFGGIDGLVNVAALDRVMGGIDDTSWADWEATTKTNVLGTMRMTIAATAALKARGGSIVFIGSQASLYPRIMQTAYAATKGAMLSAVPSLALELGQYKIRVNTVVATWMWGPAVEGYVTMSAEQRGVPVDVVKGEIESFFPMREIPRDDDVADCVSFFLSDRARMISGQMLLVNGAEFPR
jgi:NAD(P)-dependent dehydrogenase (short-subunit alcohol dehydrogenase family)